MGRRTDQGNGASDAVGGGGVNRFPADDQLALHDKLISLPVPLMCRLTQIAVRMSCRIGGTCSILVLFLSVMPPVSAAPPDSRAQRVLTEFRVKRQQVVVDESLPDRPIIEVPRIRCTAENLRKLAALGTIRRVVATRHGMTDEGIAELPRFPQLEFLGLTDCVQATDQGLKHIGSCRSLKVLQMNRLRISNDGLQHLAGLEFLETLEIAATNRVDGVLRVSDQGVAHLAGLRRLRQLNLRCSNVSDQGLAHLSALEELEQLDLSDTNIRLERDGPWDRFQKLRVLNLSRNRIAGAGLIRIAGLECLESLDLSQTEVTDAVLPLVARFSKLRYLSLAGTLITAAGVSALRELSALETLDLSGTALSDEAFQELADVKSLRSLHLDRTQVAGGIELGHLQKLTTLETLTLAETRITDPALENLRNVISLRALDVSGTSITDEGLKRLSTLPRLTTVDVSGTGLKLAELRKLRRDLPRTSLRQLRPRDNNGEPP